MALSRTIAGLSGRVRTPRRFERHANKFESIFLFAEYFGWREQVLMPRRAQILRLYTEQ